MRFITKTPALCSALGRVGRWLWGQLKRTTLSWWGNAVAAAVIAAFWGTVFVLLLNVGVIVFFTLAAQLQAGQSMAEVQTTLQTVLIVFPLAAAFYIYLFRDILHEWSDGKPVSAGIRMVVLVTVAVTGFALIQYREGEDSDESGEPIVFVFLEQKMDLDEGAIAQAIIASGERTTEVARAH